MFKTLKVSIIIGIACILMSCSSLSMTHHTVEFFDKFCISPDKGYVYKLGNKVEVQVDDVVITIPKNFQTDLASIPRWYWSILSPNNSTLIAPAILHDYLYACDNYFNQQQADEIFYYALIKNGASNSVAYRMYIAVRLFGEAHYHKGQACPPPTEMD